jgi:uncharacterized membrane protein
MMTSKTAGILLTSTAFVGLIDSAYLGIFSLQGFIVPCGLTGGCDEVLNSSYSHLFGVSISWFGFGYYGFVAACSLFSTFGFAKLLRFSLVATVSAFMVTLYLLYVQAFVLRAFCQYCLLSAFLVTAILGLHLLVQPWKRPRAI